MKTIIHLVPSWPSTYRKYDCVFLYEQIRNLAIRSNYEYIVVVGYPIGWYLKNKKNPFSDKPLNINLPNVKIYHFFYPNIFRFYQSFNFIYYFFLKKVLKNYLKTSNLLVHAHFLNMGYFAKLLFEEFGTQYFLTEHSGKFENYHKNYKFSWLMINYIIDSSYQIIAVSTHVENELLLHTNLRKNKGKIVVIPNGVENTVFYPLDITKADSPFKLLYVGNLLESKGVKILLESFLEIHDKCSCNLSIIGAGELFNYCEEFIVKNDLRGRVKLMGSVNNNKLPVIINNHHLLILPSYSESFGVVIIESISCGIPVIVTKCGGPEYIVENSSLGEIIPIGNVQALSKSIIKVCQNYIYDKKYMHDNIKKRFGWDAVCTKILKKYKSFELQ